MQKFEKLEVWQQARKLVKEIYLITREYPDDEKFGLTSQIRHAVISVSSNIAEGAGRTSPKDQKHFYTFAYSSLYEVLSQLILSADLGFIKEETLNSLRGLIKQICGQLSNLCTYADTRIKNLKP